MKNKPDLTKKIPGMLHGTEPEEKKDIRLNNLGTSFVYHKRGFRKEAYTTRGLRAGMKHVIDRFPYFNKRLDRAYSDKAKQFIIEKVMEKAVYKMLTEEWVMPLPNKMGSIYMAQTKQAVFTGEDGKIVGDKRLEKLLRRTQNGVDCLRVVWDKKGTGFRHKYVYTLNVSGRFRIMMVEEVLKRADNPELKQIRGRLR